VPTFGSAPKKKHSRPFIRTTDAESVIGFVDEVEMESSREGGSENAFALRQLEREGEEEEEAR
jgi:hypothetical protein